MSEINHPLTLGNTREGSSPFSSLTSPLMLSIFLAFVTGMTFFTSEHSLDMSKTNALNFVQDIEDQESWSEGGNKLRQISFLGCAGIGALSLLFGRTGRFRINLPVVLIAIYVLWAGASIVWSIEPGTTMRRYVLVLCCVVGCFGFSRFLRVEDTVLAAVFVSLAYLAVGVALKSSMAPFALITAATVSPVRFIPTFKPQALRLVASRRLRWRRSSRTQKSSSTEFFVSFSCS